MESQILQLLIEGGSTGIALASLFLIYKMTTNHSKHIEESTNRFTEAMDRNSEAWAKNSEALGRLTEAIKEHYD